LPSQGPTNVWHLEAAQRLLDERLRDHTARLLPPVSAVSPTWRIRGVRDYQVID